MAKLPLDIRCRLAFLEGAEERSRCAVGRPLTVGELLAAVARYPGDPLPSEVSRRRRTLVADHELLEDDVRARNEARIYEAQRAGVVSRFSTAHGPERAEAAVASWESEAERRGVARGTPAFWRDGERWIAEEVARR